MNFTKFYYQPENPSWTFAIHAAISIVNLVILAYKDVIDDTTISAI